MCNLRPLLFSLFLKIKINEKSDSMEKITLLHTNDLHSHFENWPVIRRFIKEKQANVKEDETVIVLDIGDFSDRVHPLTEATNALANVALMNQVAYDGATIGNNEGIGNTHEQLEQLYTHANFPVIISNLENRQADKLNWAKSFDIILSQKGTRVALIGLTAPFNFTYNALGWQVSDVDEVLPDLLNTVKKQADIIVLLSHLGYSEDDTIAEKYPEIDIIIGSHTHHLYQHGKYQGTTLIAAAGRFGDYVGEITIELKQHQIQEKSATTYQTKGLTRELEDIGEIEGYIKNGKSLLASQKIAHLPFTLETDGSSEHQFIDEALKALEHFEPADIYMLSTGLFLAPLKKGLITNKELHEVLPHPMHLVKVTLKGKDLIEALIEIKEQQPDLLDKAIVGMGFRGKVFGEIKMTHLNIKDDSYLINNVPITLDKIYSMVMVDHYIFVKFFSVLQKNGEVTSLAPSLIRNVVGKYLSENYPCE